MIKRETLNELERELELWLEMRKNALLSMDAMKTKKADMSGELIPVSNNTDIEELKRIAMDDDAKLSRLFKEKEVIEKSLFTVSISLSAVNAAIEARKILMEIDMIGQMNSVPSKGMIIQ